MGPQFQWWHMQWWLQCKYMHHIKFQGWYLHHIKLWGWYLHQFKLQGWYKPYQVTKVVPTTYQDTRVIPAPYKFTMSIHTPYQVKKVILHNIKSASWPEWQPWFATKIQFTHFDAIYNELHSVRTRSKIYNYIDSIFCFHSYLIDKKSLIICS